MIGEKKEKRILLLSFVAGLFCAGGVGIRNLQPFPVGADGRSLRCIGVDFHCALLFLTPLFHKPISEKHPYGFFQVESVFLIIKGFMLIAVTVSVSVQVISSALSGGNPVERRERFRRSDVCWAWPA